MSGIKVLALALIIAGAIALAYEGITYNKTREVLRIGDASITATTKEHVRIPLYVGFALVAGGVALLFVDRRRPA